MILLNGHGLQQKRKVPMVSMSLSLKEREGTATMVPADPSGIGIGDWLQDDTNPGKNIVWRVKGISQAFNRDTVTVQLEHAISLLKDRILFGEVTPATITGNSKAKTCTAKQAVQYILSKQSDWVLGSFGFTDANPYKFDGNTLYDAIETVTDSLKDAEWTYDMRQYPFILHITKYDTATDSILRPGRNLRTVTKTIDKSGMFTRFYPIGKNDLHLDGGYAEKNVNKYGVVSKVETDQSIDSQAELARWAQERLDMYAEPTVTIDVEGLELADATGESMDRLRLGQMCKVPLNEFGTEILERIVALNYPDKVRQPESVRITLANNRRDVVKILAEEMKKAGKSGRSSAKKAKEDLAWFEDTNDHVAMCAKGIIGVDAQGNPNWYRLSQIYVDGTGIHQTVTEVQNDVEKHETRFDQDEKKIGMVVGEKKGKNFIKAGEIVLAINDAGESEAHISADKVYIGKKKSTTVINGKCSLDDVTANFIKSRIATLAVLNVRSLSVTGTISCGGYVYGNEFVIGSSTGGSGNKYVSNAITALQFKTSGGTVTLQKKDFGDSSWVDVDSFNRATSLSGDWSGGKITMSANASNVPDLVQEIRGGDASWSGRTATIKIYAYTANGQLIGETGRSVSATYTLAKTNITLTRQKKTTEPTADGTLSAITSNGWYLLTITAAGTEKTYKVQVNV